MIKAGFIGLGLIGGSLAKTIKRIYPESEVYACDKDTAAVDLAVSEGIVKTNMTHDEITDPKFLPQLDYLFLCAPVITNIKILKRIMPKLGDMKLIVSDVGSVKTEIAAFAKENNITSFIGGHPMVGSEKTGFAASSDHMFENAYYILTTDMADEETFNSFSDFIASLGAIPVAIESGYHDFIMSGISHLPHFVAASLVNTVNETSGGADIFKKLAAGGFKDITRIASSSPEMWSQIALTNKDNILAELDKCIESLNSIRSDIDKQDKEAIMDFFKKAGEYRNSIPNSGLGVLDATYSIYCDLADETGEIAKVAGLLANAEISIKNIGIVHNREFRDGALLIEFYDAESKDEALILLSDNKYTIYH